MNFFSLSFVAIIATSSSVLGFNVRRGLAVSNDNCDLVADVVIADDSLQVGQKHFGQMKTFAKSLMKEFTIDKENTWVSFTEFSELPSIRTTFKNPDNMAHNKQQLFDKLDTLQYTEDNVIYGSTNTGYAISKIFEHQFHARPRNDEAPFIIILITDGESNDIEDFKATEMAEKYRKLGNETGKDLFHIIGVGIAMEPKGKQELKTMSDDGLIFTVNHFDGLKDIVEGMSNKICEVIPPKGDPSTTSIPISTSTPTSTSPSASTSTQDSSTSAPAPVVDGKKDEVNLGAVIGGTLAGAAVVAAAGLIAWKLHASAAASKGAVAAPAPTIEQADASPLFQDNTAEFRN
eukprot:Pgem_evm1s16938